MYVMPRWSLRERQGRGASKAPLLGSLSLFDACAVIQVSLDYEHGGDWLHARRSFMTAATKRG